VHSFLLFIKHMTSMCLQSLQHRFVDWTKPSTPALLLGTVADLARSKSELVAENALLRQQLLILRRQVETTSLHQNGSDAFWASGKDGSDLEAGAFHRSARDAPAVASSGISAGLEVQVQGSFSQTKDIPRDRGLEKARWQGTIDCGERNGSGANCSSWCAGYLGHRFEKIGILCMIDQVSLPSR